MEAALPTPPALTVNTSTSANAMMSTLSALASINSPEPASPVLTQPTTTFSTDHASAAQSPALPDNIRPTIPATMSRRDVIPSTHSQENASPASASTTSSTPMEPALRSSLFALPDNMLSNSAASPSLLNALTSILLSESALTASKDTMLTVEFASASSALKVKFPPNTVSSVPTSHLSAIPTTYSMATASAAKTPTTQ